SCGCRSSRRKWASAAGCRRRSWRPGSRASAETRAQAFDLGYGGSPTTTRRPDVPPPEHDNLHELPPELLDSGTCAAIAPPLRKLLRDAIASGQHAARDPAAVVADTLASLALLESGGEVLAAAILHVSPTLAEAL